MASTYPLIEKKEAHEITIQEEDASKPIEKKEFSEEKAQKDESATKAFVQALAKEKLKNKSHTIQIGRKYTKRFCVYLSAIGFFVLLLYFLAPVFDVPATYLIVPLFSAIGGTLVGSKVNKLIDSAGFCVPKWMLDENSKILVDAEHRLEELRELDKKSGKDDYATVIQELDNNVSVCQAINEAGSKHFINLFIKDIKLLMKIPCRSMSEVYHGSMTEAQIKKRRAQALAQARVLFTPYDLQSKHILSTFTTEIMDRILTPKGYNKTIRVKPLLLNGPPGIGKTFLIKSLGKILDAPVCVINMGKETLEKVEGVLLSSSSGTGPMPIAGLILKDLTNPHTNPSGCKDIFVLLDEIDKAFIGTGKDQSVTEATAKFISFLHHFLQMDILKMHDKGYNVMYGIENVYVICTANRNCFMDPFIEPSTRASLMDRVDVINMPDLTQKSKMKILNGILKEKMDADKDLSKLQKILMQQFMEGIINQIVAEQESIQVKTKVVASDAPCKEKSFDVGDSKSQRENEVTAKGDSKSQPEKEIKAKGDSKSDAEQKAVTEIPQKTKNAEAQTPSSEVNQKEQTGLRKALERLDVYYRDHYILLEERLGVKSLARLIEEYCEEPKPDFQQDLKDSIMINIYQEEAATPLLVAYRMENGSAEDENSERAAMKNGSNTTQLHHNCR